MVIPVVNVDRIIQSSTNNQFTGLIKKNITVWILQNITDFFLTKALEYIYIFNIVMIPLLHIVFFSEDKL